MDGENGAEEEPLDHVATWGTADKKPQMVQKAVPPPPN